MARYLPGLSPPLPPRVVLPRISGVALAGCEPTMREHEFVWRSPDRRALIYFDSRDGSVTEIFHDGARVVGDLTRTSTPRDECRVEDDEDDAASVDLSADFEERSGWVRLPRRLIKLR